MVQGEWQHKLTGKSLTNITLCTFMYICIYNFMCMAHCRAHCRCWHSRRQINPRSRPATKDHQSFCAVIVGLLPGILQCEFAHYYCLAFHCVTLNNHAWQSWQRESCAANTKSAYIARIQLNWLRQYYSRPYRPIPYNYCLMHDYVFSFTVSCASHIALIALRCVTLHNTWRCVASPCVFCCIALLGVALITCTITSACFVDICIRFHARLTLRSLRHIVLQCIDLLVIALFSYTVYCLAHYVHCVTQFNLTFVRGSVTQGKPATYTHGPRVSKPCRSTARTSPCLRRPMVRSRGTCARRQRKLRRRFRTPT